MPTSLTAPTGVNPLLTPSPLPYGFPDFGAIREEHFAEAFAVAMAEHRAEVAAITARPGPPTFDDTVVALERSGATLRRVSAVFFVLVGSCPPRDPRDRGAGGAPARRARRRDRPGPGAVRPAGRPARRAPRTRPRCRVAAPAGTPSPRRGPSRCPPRPRRAGAVARAERRAVDVVHRVRHPAARRHERRGPRRRRPRAARRPVAGRGRGRRARRRGPRARRPLRAPARPAHRTSPRSPRSPTGRCGAAAPGVDLTRRAGQRARHTRHRPADHRAAGRAGGAARPPAPRLVGGRGRHRRTVEAVEKMLAELVPHAVRNADAEAAELAAAPDTRSSPGTAPSTRRGPP